MPAPTSRSTFWYGTFDRKPCGIMDSGSDL
jgi:hypothetical protein